MSRQRAPADGLHTAEYLQAAANKLRVDAKNLSFATLPSGSRYPSAAIAALYAASDLLDERSRDILTAARQGELGV